MFAVLRGDLRDCCGAVCRVRERLVVAEHLSEARRRVRGYEDVHDTSQVRQRREEELFLRGERRLPGRAAAGLASAAGLRLVEAAHNDRDPRLRGVRRSRRRGRGRRRSRRSRRRGRGRGVREQAVAATPWRDASRSVQGGQPAARDLEVLLEPRDLEYVRALEQAGRAAPSSNCSSEATAWRTTGREAAVRIASPAATRPFSSPAALDHGIRTSGSRRGVWHGSQNPVWIKIYGAFVLNHRVVLHAIDATPARHRNDLVKNCRHPPLDFPQ